MKKIMVSTLIIGLLLSTAPLIMGGREAINGALSDAGEPILRGFSDDFDAGCSESLEGMMSSNCLPDIAPEFEPRQFIIKFREEVDICLSLSPDGFLVTGIASIDILNRGCGVISAEKIFGNDPVPSLSNVYKFILDDDADVLGVVREYNSDSCVVYAEPNYIYTIQKAQEKTLGIIPDDKYFSDQWALHNTGQTGGTFDADIDAPEAWEIEKGSSNVVIAVIDSGVDYNHEDLAGNMWINEDEIVDGNDTDGNGYIDDIRGWDFYNDDNDPLDDHGHGTHCSGIASAMTNNDVGIAGVCWNCTIMPVKIGTSTIPEDAAADGIIYAADNGADVISMSWGGCFDSPLVHDALEYAYSKGVFLVASAGNGNTDLKHYPSGYDNVISVAATNENDGRCDPDDWGSGKGSNYGRWVDIAAPGNEILSTLPDDEYDSWSGTSMAGPHVAGLAGLLLSKNPCPYPAGMVKTMILHTADEIDTDEYIGSGRINAYKALVRDPAVAVLHTKPSWKDNAKGTVDIEGCAWGESFQQYVLEYGRGKEQDNLTEMTSSTAPQNGVLFSWDTIQEDEGLYTIRLTVTCSDGEYTDEIWIVVNNGYNVIHVDDDNTGGPWYGTSEHPYRYVHDGVDGQGKDDTVYVHDGTYYEQHMSIEKTINLTGEDRDTTIIDGGGGDYIFLLYSSWNNITGFTITNTNSYWGICIYLRMSDNNTFSGNKITNNGYAGIFLFISSYNNISGNTITNNTQGITLYYSCYYNIISENIIKNNIYPGININPGVFNSSIVENTIEDNKYGISIDRSGYNDIHGNEIKENKYGIFILKYSFDVPLWTWDVWVTTNNTIYENNITNNIIGIKMHFDIIDGGAPWNNTIYHNNFINNRKYNAYDESFKYIEGRNKNYWDNGYSDPFDPQTDGGNYWDNYIGVDFYKGPNQDEPGKDGIGDRPYKIPPILYSDTEDRYPLKKPYGVQNSQSSQSQQSNLQQIILRGLLNNS